MSSTSLVDHLQDYEGTEFPFPTQPPSPTSESDATPPHLARSLPSHRSSTSTQARHHRHLADDDSEYRKDAQESSSARLIQRLASRSDRDMKHIRALLVSTNQRLDAETRRADQAEQRVVDVLHRLRAAHEATGIARADAFKAQQEVRLYAIRLEEAQREITRAQDIVDELERSQVRVEEQAARDRSLARRYKEEFVLSRAREDGRREGYLEGLERGRRIGFSEVQGRRPVERAPPPRQSSSPEYEDQEGDEDARRYERRARSAPVPSVERMSPPPQPMPYRPHHSQPIPAHVPDFGPIGATLPVPTVTTPINAPSPSHERPSPPSSSSSSPPPLPVSESDRRRDPTPIPVYDPPRSPSHPPVDMLPDGYIPYARDNDTNSIVLPPPHELERPLSSMEPSPPPSDARLPAITTDEIRVAPPPGMYSRNPNTAPSYEPSVRSRDYAFNGGPSSLQPANVMNSPQSKTSTNISQYEMVKPPRYDRTFAREVERERTPQPYYDPREMRSREAPVVPENSSSSGSSSRRSLFKRTGSSDYRTPLDRIFRKRAKSKRSPENNQELHPPVPDITIESPSTETSRPNSPPHSPMTEPHLLSPEHATTALPSVLQTLLGPPADQSEPLPIPTYDHQQPLPIPTREQGPLPIPNRERSPLPIPMHEQSPLPIPMRGQDSPLYIPPPEPIAVYHTHTPYAPIPPPKSPAPYTEAPVPSNVVYPSPPGRPMSRTGGAASVRSNEFPRGYPASSAPTNDSGDSLSSRSLKSRRTRRSLADSYAGRLSPLSLGFGSNAFGGER